MKKILWSAACLTLLLSGRAQEQNVREDVFVQLNSTLVLTGETLYFSAFVNSAATGQPSPLSTILYVELIGKDDKPYSQQKIALKNARGHGSFFVSSLVPTGSYRLIAYTRWMRNFGDYFQSPIQIVNPFETYEPPAVEQDFTAVFYPEGGILLPEKSNLLVYRITDTQGNAVAAAGRVVSSTGEKIGEISSGANGYGRILLEPKAGETYQAIIEDQFGQFQFFNLPRATPGGTILQVREEARVYRVTAISTGEEILMLDIHDGQNSILQQQMTPNSSILIPKEKLTTGTYRAVVSTDQQEVASRVFYHDGAAKIISENLPKTYSTRSRVEIPMSFDLAGNISISVSKKDQWSQSMSAVDHARFGRTVNPAEMSGTSSTTDWASIDNQLLAGRWKWNATFDGEVAYLPELRGEFISGKAIPETGKTENIPVSFSLSGEYYQLQTASTNEKGEFLIRVDPAYGAQSAFVSAPGMEGPVGFSVESPFLTTYPAYQYPPLVLDSAQVAALIARSVRNQIENAYYDVKKDSVTEPVYWQPQFGDFTSFYVLDDYNRFPEMYEHFIEFIPEVLARKNKNGSRIRVFLQYATTESLDPLILLDGVPASAEEVLNFSPYKIESIGVINNRVFIGPLVADGVVSFHTFQKDLHGFTPGVNTLAVPYAGLEPNRVFTSPQYDEADTSLGRIPDYRQQLHWQPEVLFTENETIILEFFTADTPGLFEVAIDGYSADGTPISLRKYFTVKEPNPPASN